MVIDPFDGHVHCVCSFRLLYKLVKVYDRMSTASDKIDLSIVFIVDTSSDTKHSSNIAEYWQCYVSFPIVSINIYITRCRHSEKQVKLNDNNSRRLFMCILSLSIEI
jgi:hypothetical protein